MSCYFIHQTFFIRLFFFAFNNNIKGAFGIVNTGFFLGKKYAVKQLIAPEDASDETKWENFKEFHHEIILQSQFQHPHLLSLKYIYQSKTKGLNFGIVMPICEGSMFYSIQKSRKRKKRNLRADVIIIIFLLEYLLF